LPFLNSAKDTAQEAHDGGITTANKWSRRSGMLPPMRQKKPPRKPFAPPSGQQKRTGQTTYYTMQQLNCLKSCMLVAWPATVEHPCPIHQGWAIKQ
jgi:hypothetical protein